MPSEESELRRKVIRRVRYAMNTLALQRDDLPPEGPLDVAITNGLLAILGEDGSTPITNTNGRTLPASQLLIAAAESGILPPDECARLQEALAITQPMRHGSIDDEWIAPVAVHLKAVENLDKYPGLRILDKAKAHPRMNDLIVAAFYDAADDHLWDIGFDPKGRSMLFDPQHCDECGRQTFILRHGDDYGGSDGPGKCLACGHEVSEAEADETATWREIRAAVERD